MIDLQTLRKMLRAYWETYRPQEYQQMEDPETFLTTRAQALTQELKTFLTDAQPSPSSTDYLTNLGQLQMAKSTAIEQALLELLPAPEPMTPAESDAPDRRTQLVTEFLAELP